MRLNTLSRSPACANYNLQAELGSTIVTHRLSKIVAHGIILWNSAPLTIPQSLVRYHIYMDLLWAVGETREFE